MSPVRGKKAKSASKKKSSRPPRPAARSRSAKPAKKAAKAKAKPAAKAAKGKAPGTPERRHCIAVDPFGDPCQSAPRLPSKYCTIHSYLDR